MAYYGSSRNPSMNEMKITFTATGTLKQDFEALVSTESSFNLRVPTLDELCKFVQEIESKDSITCFLKVFAKVWCGKVHVGTLLANAHSELLGKCSNETKTSIIELIKIFANIPHEIFNSLNTQLTKILVANNNLQYSQNVFTHVSNLIDIFMFEKSAFIRELSLMDDIVITITMLSFKQVIKMKKEHFSNIEQVKASISNSMKTILQLHLIEFMNDSFTKVFQSMQSSYVNSSDYVTRYQEFKHKLENNQSDVNAEKMKAKLDEFKELLQLFGLITDFDSYSSQMLMLPPSSLELQRHISMASPVRHTNYHQRVYGGYAQEKTEPEQLGPCIEEISKSMRDLRIADTASMNVKELLSKIDKETSIEDFTEMIKQMGLELQTSIAVIYANYHKVDLQ